MFKFKAFADDNLNVAQMMNTVFDRVENIVAKGWLPAFSPFPTMFLASSSGSWIPGLLGKGFFSRIRVDNYGSLFFFLWLEIGKSQINLML